MNSGDGDVRQSLLRCEAALSRMREFGFAPTPRNYAFWYAYVSGEHRALKKAVDDTVARQGTIDETVVAELYDRLIVNTPAGQSVAAVGSRAVDEIEHVMATIDAARGTASAYGETLHDLKNSIQLDAGRDAVRGIIEMLVRETQAMERSNRQLEERLLASRSEIMQLHENLEATKAESLTDPLTGLANRKRFDAALEAAGRVAESGGQELALMMVDIDSFKGFNDRYGHLTGDQVLRLVASAFQQTLGPGDVAARFGGDEFAAVLPGKSLAAGAAAAQKIRTMILGKELVRRSTGETLGRITVSIGVAAWEPGDDIRRLVERADVCLYTAKREGRNRVVSEIGGGDDGSAAQVA